MGIPILNPALHSEACCLYGDWFSLDLLLKLSANHRERGAEQKLTDTCPACGAAVTVDWATESVTFEVRREVNEKGIGNE